LFYKAAGSGEARGGLTMGEKNDRIKELEKQIEDLMRRWPAHSVKPAMVQRLDELEYELERARGEAGKSENREK
jgi:ATP phosphoribosyltransferase regulatory subunit HisZ